MIELYRLDESDDSLHYSIADIGHNPLYVAIHLCPMSASKYMRGNDCMLDSIRINITFLWNNSIKWTGRIFALIGLICTFASPSELLSKNASIWIRILLSAAILLTVWIVTFLATILYTLVIHRRKILDLSGGYHVYLQYGDLFSANEVIEPNSRRNIVIPVNRCFDTIVDDKLISSNSLHGKAFKNIYASTCLTPQTLSAKISDSLISDIGFIRRTHNGLQECRR